MAYTDDFGDDLRDHAMGFNQSFRDAQHLWSQDHAFGRSITNDRHISGEERKPLSNESARTARLLHRSAHDRRRRTRVGNKRRKSDRMTNVPSPRPRPILEKWGPTYLILHPNGTTYWAHRTTLDRQRVQVFDEGYRGIGINNDVYDIREGQTTEYHLHFLGRPEEELWWAKEAMLSPELLSAIRYPEPQQEPAYGQNQSPLGISTLSRAQRSVVTL